jgi:hypothetical protein
VHFSLFFFHSCMLRNQMPMKMLLVVHVCAFDSDYFVQDSRLNVS